MLKGESILSNTNIKLTSRNRTTKWLNCILFTGTLALINILDLVECGRYIVLDVLQTKTHFCATWKIKLSHENMTLLFTNVCIISFFSAKSYRRYQTPFACIQRKTLKILFNEKPFNWYDERNAVKHNTVKVSSHMITDTNQRYRPIVQLWIVFKMRIIRLPKNWAYGPMPSVES